MYLAGAALGVSGTDEEETRRGYTCIGLGLLYNFTWGQAASRTEIILANIAIWSWLLVYTPPQSNVATPSLVQLHLSPGYIGTLSTFEF